MVLEPAGISIKQVGQPVQFIANELPVESNTTTLQDLFKLLEANSNLIQKQSIDIVLSNNFVRFGLLPWRDDVFKKADWQALATAHMQQIYGSVVGSWQVHTQAQGYGKPYLISAIDTNFLVQLEIVMKQLAAKVESVTPVFDYVAERYKKKLSNDDALLIAEPGRLVLGVWKQNAWQSLNINAPLIQRQSVEVDNAIQRLLATESKKPSNLLLFGVAKQYLSDLEQSTRLVEVTAGVSEASTLGEALLEHAL